MKITTLFIMLCGLVTFGNSAHASCQNWGVPYKVGEMKLEGVSGMAASKRFPGSFYHAQDRNRIRALYRTNEQGTDARSVNLDILWQVNRPINHDIESVAVGPCRMGGAKSCLYVGDLDKQGSHKISVAIEGSNNGPIEQLIGVQGDYDGLAVHPVRNDIYLSQNRDIFRINWSEGRTSRTKIGSLATIVAEKEIAGLSIAPDGKSFLALGTPDTVAGIKYVYEIDLDLSELNVFPGVINYRKVLLPDSYEPQGVTYSLDGKSFYYNSDQCTFAGCPPTSPIMRSDCQDQ